MVSAAESDSKTPEQKAGVARGAAHWCCPAMILTHGAAAVGE